jgi:hypothetical protein
MTGKLNVALSPSHRLTSDGMQFIVQERHIVDPTRSPVFKDGMDATLREEWKDRGYYRLNAEGLRCAIESVVIRDVAESDAETLTELFGILRAEIERITTAISRGIDGKLGALASGQ